MAVTIHVDKGWGVGVASRDGDKDLRESDDVRAMGFCQLWAESLFLYRWGGHFVVLAAEWGPEPSFRGSMPSRHIKVWGGTL